MAGSLFFGSGFPALNCVDMSRWGGPLTEQEARDLWNLGVRHIIVGTGHPNGAGMWAHQQSSMWMAVNGNKGATFDAYIYLYMAGMARQQVHDALATVSPRMWWLDAEDVESPWLTPAERRTFLVECLAALGDRTVGIYTGRWWWVPNMANSTAFAHLPLWNSYYDGDPDTDGLPYGGWVDSTIEQYQGTTILAGQSVDLNYAKNLEDDMGMTPDERIEMAILKQAVERLEKIVVRNGIDLDNDGEADTFGDAALLYAEEHGWSAFLSATNAQRTADNHIAAPHGAAGGMVSGTFVGTITGDEPPSPWGGDSGLARTAGTEAP